MRRTGRLPQNANFAISEGTAHAFLDANNLPYEVEPSLQTMPSADIAAKARNFTVRVECWKQSGRSAAHYGCLRAGRGRSRTRVVVEGAMAKGCSYS